MRADSKGGLCLLQLGEIDHILANEKLADPVVHNTSFWVSVSLCLGFIAVTATSKVVTQSPTSQHLKGERLRVSSVDLTTTINITYLLRSIFVIDDERQPLSILGEDDTFLSSLVDKQGTLSGNFRRCLDERPHRYHRLI